MLECCIRLALSFPSVRVQSTELFIIGIKYINVEEWENKVVTQDGIFKLTDSNKQENSIVMGEIVAPSICFFINELQPAKYLISKDLIKKGGGRGIRKVKNKQ